jgi:aminomethyltransferase
MYMPTCYTTPEDEYRKLISGVTLWDVACERQIEISGPHATRLIQLLTPRNLLGCKSGQCRYVVLTDDAGGIINDAVLLKFSENKYWLSPGDGDVLLWVEGVALRSGLDARVHEPDVSPLQLQGPKAPHVAKKLFGPLALELGYYNLVETQLNGIPLVLSRTGWSGELGYELYLRDGSRGAELWDAIMAAGEEYGIAPAAPNTIRSIEGGILSYCSDITRADNPYVIGMERFVDLDMDTDFIGKAALKKIHAAGVKRRLVGFEATAGGRQDANADFWPVLHEDKPVGHVTRAAWSPRLEKFIGFVNIPTQLATIGTRLMVASGKATLGIKVVATPFITAEKVIPARLE